MSFRDDLDRLAVKVVQVKDLTNGTTEWFESVDDWKNQLWTLVNELRPHSIEEDVDGIRGSVLDLSDEKSLVRFRSYGSRSTLYFMSLERLGYLLENTRFTHVFIKGIGELTDSQIMELREWIGEKKLGND
jgi:hypothetical protein